MSLSSRLVALPVSSRTSGVAFVWLLALVLGLLVWSPAAMAESSLMVQAKQLYKVKQWDQALYSLQKELRRLRGKAAAKKVPVYLMIGQCLYQRGDKGLAWKAFEQALFIQPDAALPPMASSAIRAFVERVRKRVSARVGATPGATAKDPARQPKPPSSGGPGRGTVSPWPWVVLAVSAAALTGGVALVANAAANQGDLDLWLKTGVEQGQILATLETSAQSMRGSISLQNIVGGISLGVAGLGIAGAVTLFVLDANNKPAPPATSHHLRPSPSPLATSSTVLQVQ